MITLLQGQHRNVVKFSFFQKHIFISKCFLNREGNTFSEIKRCFDAISYNSANLDNLERIFMTPSVVSIFTFYIVLHNTVNRKEEVESRKVPSKYKQGRKEACKRFKRF